MCSSPQSSLSSITRMTSPSAIEVYTAVPGAAKPHACRIGAASAHCAAQRREARMAYVTTDDGVRLYCEETGSGAAVIFVHEFAGDCRSWEAQLRFFGPLLPRFAYNARGYPPSDVPDATSAIPRHARPTTLPPCWRGLASPRRMSWGCRWAGLRRCISACAMPPQASDAGGRRLRLWRRRRAEGEGFRAEVRGIVGAAARPGRLWEM